MLNRLRQQIEPYFLRIGKLAAGAGIPPLAWTYLGVLLALSSALAYSGYLAVDGRLGGILLLASGLADIIDGSVARVLNRVSTKGAFLDSTLDRLGEIFVFFGILAGGLADPFIVVVALSFSLMVSYVRARAEGLGVNTSGIGIGERAERLLVLGVMSIIGYTWLGVLAVLVLSVFTTAERAYHVSTLLAEGEFRQA